MARPAGAVAVPSRRTPRTPGPGVDVPTAGALLVLAALVGVAVLAGVLASYAPREVAGPPLATPGPRLPLGTDELGRDLWSLWIYGTRTSLLLGASVGLLSTAAAAAAGIASAGTHVFARIVSAFTELVAAIPVFLLLVLTMALTGPSLGALVLALSTCGWAVFARVVRVQTRVELQRDFVAASQALGATPVWVLRRHVLPQLAPLLWTKFLLTVRWAVVVEATLGIVGLSDPVRPSWGSVLGSAFSYPLLFAGDVWLRWAGPPALSVALLTWSCTAVGELAAGTGGRRNGDARGSAALTGSWGAVRELALGPSRRGIPEGSVEKKSAGWAAHGRV